MMAFIPRRRQILGANGLLMKWLNLGLGCDVVVCQGYVGIEGINRWGIENAELRKPGWLIPR